MTDEQTSMMLKYLLCSETVANADRPNTVGFSNQKRLEI
jgi:hypothetical protein